MKTRPTRAIFIHGNRGANADFGCFPYIDNLIRAFGIEIIRVNFPDPIRGRMKYWMPFLESLQPNENTLIVGHSSGTSAALRYAETNKIYGSLLISAQSDDCGLEFERFSGFYESPFNWQQIKNNQNWIVQVHSSDDPYIPVTSATNLSNQLSSTLILTNQHGHFTEFDFATDSIPRLQEILTDKLKVESNECGC
ncbi:alpha/beta hydrolase [Spartinivicinus poritis]|uniref:Alpha/beta hydrolase n=1 Tax=Spartinivicinus poritis TaxID=2994640 RepID=A0ABT5U823_9GAMM|nr:alpha/beta hydrolase [Spartinivicinus sp. A2-2]MDE1462518.1 alpha/beta hydrolase [Spartinivicinus sp. A2-2]